MHSLRYPLAIVLTYFFLVGAPGFWIPVLSNVMTNQSWDTWIVWAFTIPPIAGLLSPLVVAAQADQRIPAQRVLAALLLASAVVQVFVFRELQSGQRPWVFLAFFASYSLIVAPAFGLLNTITLAYLGDQTERFGTYRVWGTVGWVAAGALVSAIGIDGSPVVGFYGAGWQLIAFVCAWFLPHTVPLSKAVVGLRARLGFGAFGLLKRRDIGVVIVCGGLFMMPLTAFYMHTSLFLADLGVERIAATLALGQVSEIIALLSMGWLIRRVRPRNIFIAGIMFGIVRYGLFAFGAQTNSISLVVIGIALHGLCWTMFFEFARPYLDKKAPVEFRAQVQGLMTMSTSGIGGICGTIAVAKLNQELLGSALSSWTSYWLVLTLACVICGIGFSIGFRGNHTKTVLK